MYFLLLIKNNNRTRLFYKRNATCL